MELIIWGVGAAVLGLFLGYLGYLYSKLAYSIFTSSILIFVYTSDFIVSLTGIEREPSDIASTGLLGVIEGIVPFRKAIINMGYLPMNIQIAILIFAVTFFLSRIGTWARKSFGPKPAEESTEARRQRILKSYGMKSMEELRNRY